MHRRLGRREPHLVHGPKDISLPHDDLEPRAKAGRIGVMIHKATQEHIGSLGGVSVWTLAVVELWLSVLPAVCIMFSWCRDHGQQQGKCEGVRGDHDHRGALASRVFSTVASFPFLHPLCEGVHERHRNLALGSPRSNPSEFEGGIEMMHASREGRRGGSRDAATSHPPCCRHSPLDGSGDVARVMSDLLSVFARGHCFYQPSIAGELVLGNAWCECRDVAAFAGAVTLPR